PAFATDARAPLYRGAAPGGSVTFRSVRREGLVTGGGLVASYCCSGASSTVYASRGVASGKHYYEMQLQTRTGERNPDTWTNAGVSREGAKLLPGLRRSAAGANYQVI